MINIDDISGFSFSGISTFQSCPRAYKFRYIEEAPEAFSSIEAHMGTSVHETLEWAYKQRQEGCLPDVGVALEQYKYSWEAGDFGTIKVVKEGETRENYYRLGRRYIDSFFRRVFPHDNSTTLSLEHEFRFPLDVAGVEKTYRGVIDRIARTPDGGLCVIDYKTGRVKHPLDTLQLPSYALYIFQHHPDDEIRLCYEDLREERTVSASFSRQDAQQIKEQLEHGVGEILGTAVEDFTAKPSILCLWCGYNEMCESPLKRENRPPSSEPRGACPLCDGDLKERKGKYGIFLGCSRFPQCRYTRDPSADGFTARDPRPETEGKDICPECGSLLKERKGKYGSFKGCSNYPECRFTRPVN